MSANERVFETGIHAAGYSFKKYSPLLLFARYGSPFSAAHLNLISHSLDLCILFPGVCNGSFNLLR